MSVIELSRCEWQVKRSKGVFSRCQCSNFFMGNKSVWGELSRPIHIACEREEGSVRKTANKSCTVSWFCRKEIIVRNYLIVGSKSE